jgi:hypothetical protein
VTSDFSQLHLKNGLVTSSFTPTPQALCRFKRGLLELHDDASRARKKKTVNNRSVLLRFITERRCGV